MKRRRFRQGTPLRSELVFFGGRHFISTHMLVYVAWILLLPVAIIRAEPQLSQFRCTGEDLILFCHPGTKIKIYNAIYGRSPARLCLSLPDDPCIRPELEEIGEQCNEKTECSISVMTKSLPQCWPLQSDNLQVEFECISETKHVELLSTPKTTQSFLPPLVIEEETTPNSILFPPAEEAGEREVEAEILKEIEPSNHLNGEGTSLTAGVSAEREGYKDAATEMGPIIGGSVAAVIIMILAGVLIALVVCRGHSKRFDKLKFTNESSDAEFGTAKPKESRKAGLGRINYASLDIPASKGNGAVSAISHPRPLKNSQPLQKQTKNGNNAREEKARGAPRTSASQPSQARNAASRPKTSSSETSSNGGKSKLEYGSWRVYQKPRDARAIKGSDVYY